VINYKVEIFFTFRVIIKWRFSDRVEKQMHAFMEGFNDIIPQQLLSVFDPNELEVNLFMYVYIFLNE